MPNFVEPKTYLLGFTAVNHEGLVRYLKDTKQDEFLDSWFEARGQGLTEAECLLSFYAKLCYKSLVLGKNKNLTKIRDIQNNVISIFDTAHGSVLEHCTINFVSTNVSRIFTHEMVRHRAGWAYSQTSGRYCIIDGAIDFVHDPILDSVKSDITAALEMLEKEYENLCNKIGINGWKGLVKSMSFVTEDGRPIPPDPQQLLKAGLALGLKEGSEDLADFDKKKKLTSALRRILPNGQANEIGYSINFRALRHYILMRSSRGAEWEIRKVTEQIYHMVKAKFPLLLHGAKEKMINGALEITGMKTQPYEIDLTHPDALKYFSVDQLTTEIAKRNTEVAN